MLCKHLTLSQFASSSTLTCLKHYCLKRAQFEGSLLLQTGLTSFAQGARCDFKLTRLCSTQYTKVRVINKAPDIWLQLVTINGNNNMS